jgi:Mce-associated membrane protein
VNASWYDVLGVEPGATADEIRTAWRAAVAELDPTDRRFRVLNRAAEVLLDPEKRVAYDAELAVAEAEPEQPPVDEIESPSAEAAPEATAEEAGADEEEPHEATARYRGRSLWLVPGWLLTVLAAATAVAVALMLVLLTKPSDASVESDTQAAQAAAERAIVPILSYDAHHLTQSRDAAVQYMTAGERDQYDKLFAVIKRNAPDTGTTVRARYVASGIVRSGPGRVDVLVFVDQRTYNKQHPTVPVIYKNQVTVSMEKVDGSWLVDHLTTNTG